MSKKSKKTCLVLFFILQILSFTFTESFSTRFICKGSDGASSLHVGSIDMNCSCHFHSDRQHNHLHITATGSQSPVLSRHNASGHRHIALFLSDILKTSGKADVYSSVQLSSPVFGLFTHILNISGSDYTENFKIHSSLPVHIKVQLTC